jgi:hypothetical protein
MFNTGSLVTVSKKFVSKKCPAPWSEVNSQRLTLFLNPPYRSFRWTPPLMYALRRVASTLLHNVKTFQSDIASGLQHYFETKRLYIYCFYYALGRTTFSKRAIPTIKGSFLPILVTDKQLLFSNSTKA